MSSCRPGSLEPILSLDMDIQSLRKENSVKATTRYLCI